jgi:hypothetical protein
MPAGGYAAHRNLRDQRYPARYEVREGPAGAVTAPLAAVQWADWSRDGHLLVALNDGRLQIRDAVTLQVTWELGLATARPEPVPPPAQAQRW